MENRILIVDDKKMIYSVISSFKTFSQVASIIVILVGCFVLVGWVFNIAIFKSIHTSLVTMKANTAFAFLLSGVSLWMMCKQKLGHRERRIAQTCTAIVALIGLFTLTEYMFGWNLGIDQLLFKESATAVGTSHPGRMAPTTALNFLMLGSALLLFDTPHGFRATQFFAFTGGLIGLLNFVGYAYSVKALYGIASYTQMAIHTAAVFIVLSIGILFARPNRGVMAIVTSSSVGGIIARRLLPVAIGVPFVLGWLRLWGEQAGLYGTEFGVSLAVLLSIVILIFIILHNASSLNAIDTERKKAEKALQDAHDKLEIRVQERTADLSKANIFLKREISERKRAEEQTKQLQEYLQLQINRMPIGLIVWDTEFRVQSWNPAAERIFRFTEEEALGKHPYDLIVPKEVQSNVDVAWHRLLEGDTTAHSVNENITKDGRIIICEWTNTPLREADGTATGVLSMVQDITERKRAEEALWKSEERYRTVANFTYDWEYWLGLNRNFIYVSPSCERVSGYRPEEFFANPDLIETIVHPDDRHLFSQHLNNLFDREKACHLEFRINTRSGEERWISHICQPVYSNDGSFLGRRGSNRDVTDLKRSEQEMRVLEEQFRQSQKMEAIGSLAGGVAHDFNNLLTIIKGNSQLSLMEIKADDPLRENIEEIHKASDRAATLTRQLLAFSRRQVLEVKVVDLNTILRDLDKMLRRMIREDVELVTHLTEDLGSVKVDPGQIEQVVMNFAINARDAMPSGGKLTIETANVELDEEYARRHLAVTPGRYVMLSVSDTGMGMTPEVKERIFEPFFTTKEKGKGTGLGLSTVYGIVKQSGGNIWVYSEPGQGTTFKIYFPRVDEPLDEMGKKMVEEEIPGGNETILLVEDEDDVRKLAAQVLRKQGYRVLEAPDGNDALLICKQHEGPIHLMVTDVVMPGMSGRELAEKLLPFRPEMKVIYMSGYTDNTITHHGVLGAGLHYIQKPFSVEGLARKVREILNK